jgi:hypothetical protein
MLESRFLRNSHFEEMNPKSQQLRPLDFSIQKTGYGRRDAGWPPGCKIAAAVLISRQDKPKEGMMKSGKMSFNWQSFVLGMALCAVLVVFIGSKAADAQTGSMQRVMQRQANMNDVWEKTNAMDERLIAMDERLIRVDKKMDETLQDLRMMMKALGRLESGKTGK